jgi:hypothetical protein
MSNPATQRPVPANFNRSGTTRRYRTCWNPMVDGAPGKVNVQHLAASSSYIRILRLMWRGQINFCDSILVR